MKFVVDTESDQLEDILRVLGAAYGVSVVIEGAAHGISPGPGRRPRRQRSVGAGAQPPSASDIRAWAKGNGWEVSGRGALPRSVVAAFRAAHGD